MVEISDHLRHSRIGAVPKSGSTEQTLPRRPRGRPRRWSAAEKARIVAESRIGTASIAEVARRHHVHPNQLYAWRHEFQDKDGPPGQAEQLGRDRAVDADFIPVTVASPVTVANQEGAGCETGETGTVIEVLVGSLTVRLRADAPLPVLERVLQAAWRLT